MRPPPRGVLGALVPSHDGVLPHESEESPPLLLTREGLGSAGSRHLRCPADVTKRASESEAALLERASAPSRPERHARREQRAGVASSEREEWREFSLARAMTSGGAAR